MSLQTTLPDGTTGSPLPADLREFAQELAVAVHKRGIYPPGHPMQLGAVEGVHARLSALLSTRAVLVISIAQTQLVIDGCETDPHHPLLRDLAERLHEHEIGAIRLLPGISLRELDACVAALATSPARGESPLATAANGASARDSAGGANPVPWTHLEIVPAALDQLALVDTDVAAGAARARDDDRALWAELARVALGGAGGLDDAVYHPRQLAEAVQRQGTNESMLTALQRMLDELGEARAGARPSALRSQASELVCALDEGVLAQLLDMGGDHDRRHAFLLQATQTLGANAVVELLRAAAAQDGETIADSMLRLLRKLARNATPHRSAGRAADAALRRAARRLLRDWTLDDPNPESYALLLTGLAAESPHVSEGPAERRDADAVLDVSLEIGLVTEAAELALGRLVMRDGVAAVLERLLAYPESASREQLVDRLLNEATVREQLAQPRPDLAVLQQAVDRMKGRAVGPLVQALERRDDSDATWLVPLFVRLGEPVVEPLGAECARWPARALRRALAIFDQLQRWPSDFDLVRLGRHHDASVRREAIRLLLKGDDTRAMAVQLALQDADLRTFSQGLASAMRECPPAAIPLLKARYDDRTLTAELRARVLRAAATTRTADVRRWLTDLLLVRRWPWGAWRLRPGSPEVVAAVGALARHYRGHADAERVMTLALAHRDAAVRRAARSRTGDHEVIEPASAGAPG